MVLKQQASTIQSRPVKNIGKVGKKEQNEANCTNAHVTARLQLINCFKRRTSHELNFNTRFQLPSSLRAVKYNFNVLVNSQMQCSHVIQTQAQMKCDRMHINVDAVYQGGSKFARETSKTQTALIGSIFSEEQNPPF